MAGPNRTTRGRVVVALLALAIVLYIPLWSRCSMPVPTAALRTAEVVKFVPGPPVIERVPVPCPTTGAKAPIATAQPTAAPAVREQTSPYHVHVVVFTYRRLDGLKRLLKSLVGAHYNSDDVTLTLYVDYPKKGAGLAGDGTRTFVEGFQWPHGRLNVHRRLANAGLKRTIMEAWFPPSGDREVAAFFEDDIEVSPFWYLWACAALGRFADPREHSVDEKLLGVSLFRPIHDELSGRGCVVKNNDLAFALQQPCSWGALYLPKPWRAFRNWYDEYNANGGGDTDPTVVTADGGRPSSNTWDRHSSWKKYLIKLMHERGWYMIYPNPPARTVLATNHLMKGEHPTPSRKLFELPLLEASSAPLKAYVGDARAQELSSGSGGAGDFGDTLPATLEDMWAFDVLFRRVEQGVAHLPTGSGGADV